MKRLFILIALVPSLLNAQIEKIERSNDSTDKGVEFLNRLSWKQAILKAKKEQKYILVDCYTTWCGPCKLMDKDVYINNEVGSYINRHFISIKMQMDSTKNDNDQISKRYRDVKFIEKEYGISAFPTFLFFSPKGQLLDRATGYRSAHDFISLASNAINPNASHPFLTYYKMLSDYWRGKKNFDIMPFMIDTAEILHQEDVSSVLSKDYFDYLSGISRDSLYSKKNISFLSSNIKNSQNKFFLLFYQDGERVNATMHKNGYAQSVVGRIIFMEEINPVVNLVTAVRNTASHPVEFNEPDWGKLTSSIAEKYNKSYAEENILKAKIKWCEDYHHWSDCAKWFTELVKKYTMDANSEGEDLEVNSICWSVIFKRSVDKEQIDAAIECMKGVVERVKENGGAPFAYQDTYANLLFKAGRDQEAIKQEEEALKNTIEWKEPEFLIKEFQATLEKIKRGTSTWPRYIDREDIFGMGLI
ncbi:MAG: thioredoxin fold domain-containing protein [Puia sp.]|nr:thioredoxin fold domain-containing protein [Puia sp.]